MSRKLLFQFFELNRSQALKLVTECGQVIFAILIDKNDQLYGRFSNFLQRMTNQFLCGFEKQLQISILNRYVAFVNSFIQDAEAECQGTSVFTSQPLEDFRDYVLLL